MQMTPTPSHIFLTAKTKPVTSNQLDEGNIYCTRRHQFLIVKTRVYWKKNHSIKPWITSVCLFSPVISPLSHKTSPCCYNPSNFPWFFRISATELQVRAAAQCDKGELGDPSSLKLIKWVILRHVCLIILLVFVACNPMNLIPWIFIFWCSHISK